MHVSPQAHAAIFIIREECDIGKDGALKPPLPDPLKTPPFFSQWVKLENFFGNASGTGKTPRARRPRK